MKKIQSKSDFTAVTREDILQKNIYYSSMSKELLADFVDYLKLETDFPVPKNLKDVKAMTEEEYQKRVNSL